MKFSMYMASANRLGIPHEMMTVINLGRRSSAPLQKEKSVTYIIAFSTVFNLQSNVFNFPSTFQYRGSACKKEHSFPKYRVTIKCGYHLGSEPECATGIFNLWLSKVNILKTQNYTISLYTGFFTGSPDILPPNHDIPAFSGTKLMSIPLSAVCINTRNEQLSVHGR